MGGVGRHAEFKELQAKLTALGQRQAPGSDSAALFEALRGLAFPGPRAGWEALAQWVNESLQALIWNGAALQPGVETPSPRPAEMMRRRRFRKSSSGCCCS